MQSQTDNYVSLICLLLQPCGVDYEIKAYIAHEAGDIDEKVEKKYVLLHFNIKILSKEMNKFSRWFRYIYQYRDTCRLIIRKIQYAPNELSAGPKTDINKQFITADKPIHMEASMEKEVQCV